MQKPDRSSQTGEYPVGVQDTAFASRYPVLLMYLSDTKWDDGSAREPSTVSLFIDQGVFKASLNDRDGKRSMYVTGSTFQACLDALEGNLAHDEGSWRSWNNRTKKGK